MEKIIGVKKESETLTHHLFFYEIYKDYGEKNEFSLKKY